MAKINLAARLAAGDGKVECPGLINSWHSPADGNSD
jgi:hypothetical protein